jgi:predicted deacylase
MGVRPSFEIGEVAVAAGARQTVDLPIGVLSNHTPLVLPVHVIHGRNAGPTVFVSAAVHGDEINGVEIIRRLLGLPIIGKIRGTLLAIPVVNAYGFIGRSRYLPDRRDLNRSFPGSANGSLAAQLADLFLTQVVRKADVGIDLHSAAIHRTNLPQVRVSPGDERAMDLALAFGPPVIVTAPLREGSLRRISAEVGTDVLLFEAGEALRFDEFSVRAGVSGVLRVLKRLEMVSGKSIRDSKVRPAISESTYWIRAPIGGLFRAFKTIGGVVERDDRLGVISDPFGETESEVRAPRAGLIIGRTNLPVVNQGDALIHIALLKGQATENATDRLEVELQSDPLIDEDEII